MSFKVLNFSSNYELAQLRSSIQVIKCSSKIASIWVYNCIEAHIELYASVKEKLQYSKIALTKKLFLSYNELLDKNNCSIKQNITLHYGYAEEFIKPWSYNMNRISLVMCATQVAGGLLLKKVKYF